MEFCLYICGANKASVSGNNLSVSRRRCFSLRRGLIIARISPQLLPFDNWRLWENQFFYNQIKSLVVRGVADSGEHKETSEVPASFYKVDRVSFYSYQLFPSYVTLRFLRYPSSSFYF